LVGDRGHADAQFRPDRVEIIFEMLHDLAGIGGGRGHQEIVSRQPPGGAVVEGDAFLAQHQPVAGLVHGRVEKVLV
jgi:hypothetical protein